MINDLPMDNFEKSIERLKEIFIWNRALSNLNSSKKIRNAKEFLKFNLLKVKGPYIEYIAAPKFSDVEFTQFCEKLNIDPSVIFAYKQVLFKKNTNCFLYNHQSKFIESVFSYENCDFTLSVPTASGKTEAFLLPILDVCIKDRSNTLKSILFYPTKTLAVDQLNRIIKYIYAVNLFSKKREINIGIWDGDTKQEVNNDADQWNSIKPDSIIRGIKCPECSNKLKIGKGEVIYCDNCNFESYWIKATRRAIKNGVDILITNPEAFDYLFVDPNEDKINIIGDKTFNENVKYVVFDEAHTWFGASGAAIHMLCQRLRFFYGDKLKFFIISATINDPKTFGKKITGRENITINFEPETIYYNLKKVDYGRIPACLPEKAFSFLHEIIKLSDNDTELVNSIDNLKDKSIIQLLHLLKYFEGNKLSPSLNSLVVELKNLTFEEFITNELFVNDLKLRVINHLPEVLHLRDFLSKKDDKQITFTHFLKVVDYIKENIEKKHNITRYDEEYQTITISLLTIGRLASLLQDRLHYFIQGNDGINYCESCGLITTKKICDGCGNEITSKLLFCSTCHNIFVSTIPEIGEVSDPQDLESQTKLFELETYTPVEKECPKCGNNISRTNRLRDGSVYHPQLISQFLSVYGKIIPSKKMLVFADSRKLAERIGYDFLNNDYQLVIQKYMLSSLSKPKKAYDLYRDVINFINKVYYYPIFKSLQDSASRRIWKDFYEEELRKYARLNNASMLIEACLITPSTILENSDNDIQAFLGHLIFKKLIQTGSFKKNKVQFYGYTLERILELDLKIDNEKLLAELPCVIKNLYESNFLTFYKKDAIEANIRDKIRDEDEVNDLLNYFDKQTIALNQILEKVSFRIPDDCYGLFDRANRVFGYQIANRTDYYISKVDNVFICKSCKKAFPSIDNSLEKCPLCSNELIDGNREQGGGYITDYTSVGLPYDYWSRELSTKDNIENEVLAITVHRAGIPPELRSVIEDCFKDKIPKINIISATTTFELGIDIGDLDTVFLVGLPPGVSNYVQRAGRAGRSKGHSSTIVTFIRSGNAIDNYYFEKLETRYFVSNPISLIPENKDVEVIFACHIITLICGYLARNYDPDDTFKRIWNDAEIIKRASMFTRRIKQRTMLFTMLIKEKKYEEIYDIVQQCYNYEGILILDKILNKKNNLSIIHRIYSYLSHYENMKLSRETQKKMAENFRFFSQVLRVIGYLANYRGFMETIPIKNKDFDKLEDKSILMAIKENYPGYYNNNKALSGKTITGGIQIISMTQFITDKVYASKRILTTKICNNKSCLYYNTKAEKELDTCILCGDDLTEIEIYAPEQIIIKRMQVDLGYQSYPFIVQDLIIDKTTDSKEILLSKKTSMIVKKSLSSLVTFVPSFSYRYRSSSSWGVLPSQAEIVEDVVNTEDSIISNDFTFDELLNNFMQEEKVDTSNYVSIGYSFETRTCSFYIPFSVIVENEYEENNPVANHMIAVFESTFIQALSKAISLVIGCSIDDFEVITTNLSDKLRFSIADSSEGGNGVADSAYNNLETIISTCLDVVQCESCRSFCKKCVLLERTPEYIIKNGLLNRLVAEKVLKRLL
ncbi:MAG: DEAD/DEAH box helicase [Candidatus Heimdallarchaeum endolithica]|uniref:DEAD/DEAH box helicase n=1 Tax=Candidatus Heimdallarchaeum endolithica TaxID=2876572 RepID=A0A9Y1BQJ5_9ARCH|nr:MAG: DEAD/DEAH box helicase [Candidatus Heimdallarchaeum endolithica]